MSDEYEIAMDSREKSFVFAIADRRKLDYTKMALQCGDFALRKKEKDGHSEWLVGIERKRVQDLVNSIQSRRIFKQTEMMTRHYPLRILLIVGRLDDVILRMAKMKMKVNTSVIYGSLASIMVRNNFHILWVETDDQAIELVKRIFEKIKEGKYGKQQLARTKAELTPVDILTEFIPGVTRNTAKKLLDRFVSLHGVAEADHKQLVSVNGVGPVTARTIHRKLNG